MGFELAVVEEAGYYVMSEAQTAVIHPVAKHRDDSVTFPTSLHPLYDRLAPRYISTGVSGCPTRL